MAHLAPSPSNPWDAVGCTHLPTDAAVKLAVQRRQEVVRASLKPRHKSLKKHVVKSKDFTTYNYEAKGTSDTQDSLARLINRSEERKHSRRQLGATARNTQLEREMRRLQEEQTRVNIEKKTHEQRLRQINMAYNTNILLEEKRRKKEREEMSKMKLATELHDKMLLRRYLRRLRRNVIEMREYEIIAASHFDRSLLSSYFRKLIIHSEININKREQKGQVFRKKSLLRFALKGWKTVSINRGLS